MINEFIISIYEQILTEGREQQARSRYPKIYPVLIDNISASDPSGNNKYLMWMLAQLSADSDLDPDYLLEIIIEFHNNVKNLPKKEIEQYGSLNDLVSTLKEYEKDQQLKRGEKRKKKYNVRVTGAEVIYSDDRYMIVHPTTKDSVCFYGSGTKWCITERDQPHFEGYAERNSIFYFIIDLYRKTKDDNHKVAVVVMRHKDNSVNNYEIYDAPDDHIGDDDALDAYEDEDGNSNWGKFKEIIMNDAENQPETDESENNIWT